MQGVEEVSRRVQIVRAICTGHDGFSLALPLTKGKRV
jgi:hypothetical protein